MLTVHATGNLDCDGPLSDGKCVAPSAKTIGRDAECRPLEETTRSIAGCTNSIKREAWRRGWDIHPKMPGKWLCPHCLDIVKNS